MSAAWHGAAFSRSKRMPSLKSVLSEKTDTPFRSNDEMLSMFRQVKQQGIKLRIRKVS